MGIEDKIESTFIQRALEHALDGNRGSNYLVAIVGPVVAANLDWAKVIRGFQFKNASDTAESAKAVGLLLASVFGFFVGRQKPKAA